MKRLLITVIVAFTLSCNANSADFKRGFYIVGDIGLVKNSSKLEEDTYDWIKTQKPEGLKIKSNHGFIGDIGLGYRFTDNIRFDIKASADKSDYNYKPDTLQETSPISDITTHKAEKRNDYSKDIKIEAKDLDLSINGYYDFPDLFRGVKPFVLGGVGITNKKVKTDVRYVTSVTKIEYLKEKDKEGKEKDKIEETVEYRNQSSDTHIYKSKINPFYTLGLGVSFTHEDTPNATIDFTYKFKKNLKDNFKEESIYNEKIKTHSHYFLMGIRYHF